jgi:hypothetical protein
MPFQKGHGFIGGGSKKGSTPWNKGKTNIYSDETKKKQRESHIGKKQSPETIEKRRKTAIMVGVGKWNKGKHLSIKTEFKKGMTPWNKGKHCFEDHKRNLSLAKLGTHPTEETIEKMKKNSAHYWLGKHHTEEAKNKNREAHLGKKMLPLTKEHVRKIVETRMKNGGYAVSQETRERAKERMKGKYKGENNPFFGKHHSLETIKNISGENASNWQGGITPENKKIRKSVKFKLWREEVYKRDNYTCQKCQVKGGKLHPHHIQNFAQYPDLRFMVDNGITFHKDCHILFHKIYGQINNNQKQIDNFLIN